jgi:prevent-host-death family protein
MKMTRIAPLADVKARLSAYIEESQTEGPVVITRNGKAVAVLVSPVDDDDVESLVLARSPRLQRLLKKSRSIAAGRGLSAKRILEHGIKTARPRRSLKESARFLPMQNPARTNSEQVTAKKERTSLRTTTHENALAACRLFAVLKTQRPANRSKELLISATQQNR